MPSKTRDVDQLERELAECHATVRNLRQAIGLATTAKPDLVMDPGDPIDMMQELVEHVERLREELHGALMLTAILAKRSGGVIEIRPNEFMDIPYRAKLHKFEERDGRVLYSITEEAKP